VKIPVFWTSAAEADLLEARAFYDNIRPELGNRFAQAVDDTVEAVSENPRQFQVVHKGRRRAGVWRFPYGIFFEVQEDRVVVIACMYGRRDPRRWQAR
jgi:toxin ParE1/3/4